MDLKVSENQKKKFCLLKHYLLIWIFIIIIIIIQTEQASIVATLQPYSERYRFRSSSIRSGSFWREKHVNFENAKQLAQVIRWSVEQ